MAFATKLLGGHRGKPERVLGPAFGFSCPSSTSALSVLAGVVHRGLLALSRRFFPHELKASWGRLASELASENQSFSTSSELPLLSAYSASFHACSRAQVWLWTLFTLFPGALLGVIPLSFLSCPGDLALGIVRASSAALFFPFLL